MKWNILKRNIKIRHLFLVLLSIFIIYSIVWYTIISHVYDPYTEGMEAEFKNTWESLYHKSFVKIQDNWNTSGRYLDVAMIQSSSSFTLYTVRFN